MPTVPLRLRFPIRPVGWTPPDMLGKEQSRWVALLYQDDEDDDGDEDDEHDMAESSDNDLPLSETQPRSSRKKEWRYVRDEALIRNDALGKCVYLQHIDRASKIRRLVAALRSDPNLHVNSMVAALHAASTHRHQCSLLELIQNHAREQPIRWGLSSDVNKSA